MGDRYLTDLADVCRLASHTVIEVDGWQSRGRSSGGYVGGPDHVMCHHTASNPSSDGWDDVNYMTFHADAAPMTNLYLSRDGSIWVCAGGATNTNGSGNDPCGFLPPDTMNSHAIGIEAANNGVGETWPAIQLDVYTALVFELNEAYGIPVVRCHGHAEYAPSRKIDPAGPPRYATGSATWDMDAFRADLPADEPPPQPEPQPSGEIDMIRVDYGVPGTDDWWARMLIGGVGLTWVQGHANDGLDAIVPAHIQVADDQHMLDLMATYKCIGPPPSTWSNNATLQSAWRVSTDK